MRPTFKNQPSDYVLQNLMVKYANGTPISCDQLNFLYRHEKALSSHQATDLKRYYLKDYYLRHTTDPSFLMPHEKLDATAIRELKDRVAMLLNEKKASIEFKMQPEQFLQLRSMTASELILYHGNQFLTGAPFYPGGIPHVLYFQWGNLFGVAKYVVLTEEKSLKSNVLIYFEDMQDRYLDQCVADYQLKLKLDAVTVPKPQPQPATPHDISPFVTPTLTLSRGHEKREN